ncbi:putative DNA primase/helicase [Pseudomonas nitritireducens]|uniref:Putative DNA primase/helicase n=1 Tax=Pseudomonas nitroreducens TaxID=46680 RepID=A0A7W7KN76_PSENT|nr:toprim domain-containing protein [Pseudomonas nitritireducens]MBB4865455.1 putative DNA primase/helicase [Pseudomonas nitritireducens]
MKIKNGAIAPTGSACLEKVEITFRETLQEIYGALDWLPVADGVIHRFHVPGDKAGSVNGWYVLYADGIASGAFGSWKAGDHQTWCSRKPADALEAHLIAQRIELCRAQREADTARQHQAAAEYAKRLWRDARRADPCHPYLISKSVRSHALRQHGDTLLIPLYRNSELVNLQRISPDGIKRFLSGGQVKGCYSPLGSISPGRRLYVAEGWATAATLHEQVGGAVAAAMNANNLRPVAIALREKYGDLVEMVIAGDDDRQTAGNPGRAAAIEAAKAAKALVTFPDWPADAPLHLTDFNDLASWRATCEC